MMTRATYRLRALIRCERAVAAVELGLLAPIFMLFMALLLDLGIAYNAKLKIVSATASAAQYAFVNGQSLTTSTVPAFLTNVATVATTAADLTPSPTVTVKFNNATDGTNASNFYCLTGTSPTTLAWSSTSTVSATCGSGTNLTSGKFVNITISTTTSSLFYPNSLIGSIITEQDAAIVRVQ